MRQEWWPEADLYLSLIVTFCQGGAPPPPSPPPPSPPTPCGTVGAMTFDGVHVHGRADRIDRLADGSLAIIDYKTGTPPSAA